MKISAYLAAGIVVASVQSQEAVFNFHPCPFLGPSYPKPTSLNSDLTIADALQNITDTIELALSSGQIDNETTAFSLTAFSPSDTDTTPFFEYHNTPPSLAEAGQGVKEVTGDSIYRIGSVSKAVTMYTLLAANGFKNWQSPITDFIPELRDAAGSNTPWEEVTIEGLAAHLSGIGSDYAILDISTAPFPYTQIGLQEVLEERHPSCGGPIGQPLCTRAELLEGLTKNDPVFSPYQAPAYSNVAFQLLGYAIESITGESFEDALKSHVFEPLGMTHSYYSKPEDSLGVFPFISDDLWWNTSMGDLTPGGALYSSPKDLARFGRAILSHQQLSPAQANRWLKPLTHTSDPFASVGAPWEIQRYTLPTSPYRTIDIYSKSGGLGLYTAYLILLPDYSVGMTLNVAGSLATIGLLADLMTETLLPALEEASRLQADAAFAGHYTSTPPSSSSNGSSTSYSFTLTTAPDTPGLLIFNFTSTSTSIDSNSGTTNLLASLSAAALLAAGHYETAHELLPYFADGSASAAYEAGAFGSQLELRLFPTGLLEAGKDDGRSSKQVFRAAVDIAEASEAGAPVKKGGPFTGQCISWQLLDTLRIGGESFDRFVFEVDGEGKVVGLDHGALGVRFERAG